MPPTRVGDSIDEALQEIGEFFQVCRVAVYSDSCSKAAHEWPALGRDSPRAGEIINGVSENTLDLGHPVLGVYSHSGGAQSVNGGSKQQTVSIPMPNGTTAPGILVMHSIGPCHAWHAIGGNGLKLLAQTLSGAIQSGRLEQRIQDMAHYDPLTGLPNRKLFREILVRTVKQNRRAAGRAALLLLDLDDFKLVNDSLSHSAGDKLLQALSARLKSAVRGADVIARLGGDEFGILSPVASAADAAFLAERVLAAVDHPIEVEGQTVAVHSSIGITLAPDDADNPAALMKAADLAMYAAKGNGKNRFAFFNRKMGASATNRLRLRMDIQQALEREEFFLEYQPIVNLDSMQTAGLEALVRWDHPKNGVLRPDEFIRIAEGTSQISLIDRWVLGEACKETEHLAQTHPFRLAINLSARELYDQRHVQELARIAADRAGPRFQILEFEITETTLMRDIEAAIANLGWIKKRIPGAQIAIDDFGSGYSSLNYLRRLPIDSLKIDQTFVADLRHPDGSARAIIQSIADLGHNLGLRTVAEGIETEAQLAVIREIGCSEGQGHFFGRPAKVSALQLTQPCPDSTETSTVAASTAAKR